MPWGRSSQTRATSTWSPPAAEPGRRGGGGTICGPIIGMGTLITRHCGYIFPSTLSLTLGGRTLLLLPAWRAADLGLGTIIFASGLGHP